MATYTFTFTGTAGQVTGLVLGGSYTAQVRAVDAAGNRSALSGSVNFTTLAAVQPATVAGAATVPTPAVGVTSPATRSPQTVAATATIPTPTAGTTRTFTFTGTVGQVTGLAPAGSYTAKVRARDAAGKWSEYSSPVTFTTSAAGTDKTVSPATVAASATIPTPTAASGTTRTFTFTGTSGQVTGLTLGATYTARVRARDATGNRSAYSDPITFTTSAAVGPTVTAGPARPVVNGGSVALDVTAIPPAGQSIAGHSWQIVSGGGALTDTTSTTSTYTAPLSGSGLAIIRDTVTGSGGGISSADVTVSYHATVVAAENVLAGTPRSTWDLSSPNLGGVDSLQGFCDGFTANRDQTVNFKIAQSDGAGWTAQVYRLGWYGGDGARLYALLAPSASQLAASQSQPAPADVDPNTTLPSVDCGNWATTLTWTPPAWAPSGMYVLRLNRSGGGASHVLFTLRDDARPAHLMFMPADSTWHAYNAFGGLGVNLYGGNSLYYGLSVDQYAADCARFVSYNRPVVNRGAADVGRSYGAVEWSTFFTGEYPMLRFLERNGFDVKYYGCIDAAGDPTGTKLANVGAAMFVGHNEYWSDGMRAGWETAKATGTSVFSCAGNEVFWRLVGANNDTSGRPRTWECFKSTIGSRSSTARPQWTGTWRDPDGAGKGGNNPENTLTGTIFVVNGPNLQPLVVPSDGGYAAKPIWRHTTVSALSAGQTWTSPSQILGFEWDTYGPAGTSGTGASYMAAPHPQAQFCSDVTYPIPSGQLLTGPGDEYDTSGTATHRLVVHPGGNGAITFGTGTINWALGVDNANTWQQGGDNTSPIIQQATVNMLVDMGAVPASLMPGLTGPAAQNWYPELPSGTVKAAASIPAPTVIAVLDTSKTVSTVAGTAVIPAPAVTAGSGVTRTPATVTATAAVATPTRTAGTGAARAPATVAAAASVASPTVTASTLATAGTVTGKAAVPTPARSTGWVVTLTTVAGVAAIGVPAVRAGSLAKPTSVKALASVPQPAVVAIRTATLTPATVAGWALVPPPTAVGKVPPTTGPARVYVTSQPAAVRVTSPQATVRITSP